MTVSWGAVLSAYVVHAFEIAMQAELWLGSQPENVCAGEDVSQEEGRAPG